jgi:hypothetical protein
MTAMLASLWRSPAAGVRLFSRSICSALSSIPSAAVFSSTRATRLVPGIGAMSSPYALRSLNCDSDSKQSRKRESAVFGDAS